MSPKENLNKKDMEEIILKAAEETFLEKGYALASTTEIAKRAGCNQTLVHYYFRTKEKLFEACFEKVVALFFSSFQWRKEQDQPFLEKFRKLSDAHFETLLANQKIPFLLLNELTTNPGRIRQVKQKFRDKALLLYNQVVADIESAVCQGEIRKIEPFELLFSMASLNVSVFLLRPVLQEVVNMGEEDFQAFARKRKKENMDIILHRLTVVKEG